VLQLRQCPPSRSPRAPCRAARRRPSGTPRRRRARQQQGPPGAGSRCSCRGSACTGRSPGLLTAKHLPSASTSGAFAPPAPVFSRPGSASWPPEKDSRPNRLPAFCRESISFYFADRRPTLGWGNETAFDPSGGARVKSPAFVLRCGKVHHVVHGWTAAMTEPNPVHAFRSTALHAFTRAITTFYRGSSGSCTLCRSSVCGVAGWDSELRTAGDSG